MKRVISAACLSQSEIKSADCMQRETMRSQMRSLMRLQMGSMALFVCCLALLPWCAVAEIESTEIPEKLLGSLAEYHLMDKCWGHRNNLAFHDAVENAANTCLQLSPNFDIDLGLRLGASRVHYGLGSRSRTDNRGYYVVPQQKGGPYTASNAVLPDYSTTASAGGANPLQNAWNVFTAYQRTLGQQPGFGQTGGGVGTAFTSS
jgi:hypothetical protein